MSSTQGIASYANIARLSFQTDQLQQTTKRVPANALRAPVDDATRVTLQAAQPADSAPAAAPPQAAQQAVQQTPAESLGTDEEFYKLAQNYVDNYVSQSGMALSPEQRKAKVDEVYKFYTASDERKSRFKALQPIFEAQA